MTSARAGLATALTELRERARGYFEPRCCGQAVRLEPGDPRDVACVCAYREWCPTHGRTCVGRHD